jgi:sugar-specific transcriptional regulator TrmB
MYYFVEVEDFIRFGMTNVEAIAFKEVMHLKEASISNVAEIAGLHRGTAYNVLENLIKKGFLVSKITDKGKKYSPAGISKFNSIIDKNQKKIKQEVKLIQNISKELTEKRFGLPNKEEIMIYRGKGAYETFYKGLVEECIQNKEKFLSIGMGGTTIKSFGLPFFKMLQKYKQRLNLEPKVILDKRMENRNYGKVVHGDIRYISFAHPVPTTTRIFSDKVAFSLWESNPPVTIVVKNEELNKSYRNSFKILWDTIEKDQRELEKFHKLNLYNFMNPAENSLDIMSICGLEQIHEGREKILELLKKGKKVRILLSNPDSQNFKKRVFKEEQFIKDLSESRILFELKATIANLRDVKSRLKHDKINLDNLKIRSFNKPPTYTIVCIDNKKILNNHYGNKKGEYGGAKSVSILGEYDPEFKKSKKIFETYWKSAKHLEI